MSWQCFRTGPALEGRAAGLSPAEALRLEEHLSSCAACCERARALDGLRVALDSIPPLDDRVVSSALFAALAKAESPRATTPARRRTPLYALAAAGLAAAAALLVLRPWRESSTPPAPAVVVAPEAPVEKIVEQAPAPAAPTESGTRLALEGRTFTLAKGARFTVGRREGRPRIELESGSLQASGSELSVSTPTFAVEATGEARFHVDTESVRVELGSVQVVNPRGPKTVAAGETWTAAAPPPAETVAPKKTGPAPAALLAAARRDLARGAAAAARRKARAALAARPGKIDEAEAHTLLAECAVVAGSKTEAVRLYLGVARRYRGTSAAENALFAAARLEADRGRKASARRLFGEYRRRYPKGRLADDAAKRLEDLR